MTKLELPRHLIIAGHGRSGTNMVLDLFDCHRETFCRNEANKLVGTAFTGLGDGMFMSPHSDDFAVHWRDAIATTARTSGSRDRFVLEKSYFRSPLRARIGQGFMSRAKLRACILPRLNGKIVEQWPCPSFYYARELLSEAFPVIKIHLVPAWYIKAHEAFPSQRLIQVIRRPEKFIQSWWSRYVIGIGGGPEKVFADNQPSLRKILEYFGRQDEIPRHYSLEGLLASELWRWRYMNEMIFDNLSHSDRYMLVPYECVMNDRLRWAEEMFEFAGLDMAAECRRKITDMQNTLFKKRKDGLESSLVDPVVEQVLADSPLLDIHLRVEPGAVQQVAL